MKVRFNDLTSQWNAIKEDAMSEIEDVFNNSSYILGPYVERFEQSFANFCNVDYGIGVSSGYDAIKVAARSLDLNADDLDVFMPANSFVATWLAI